MVRTPCNWYSHFNIFPHWWPEGNGVVYVSLDDTGAVEYRSIAISGGAPQTILQGGVGDVDVGRDSRLLYRKGTGEAPAFNPRDGKDQTLGGVPDGAEYLRWLPDSKSAAYMISRTMAPHWDKDAGLWVTDFKTPPRRVFPGWVAWYGVDAQGNLFVLRGKDDMAGELWKVKCDGSGSTRTNGTIPLLYNLEYFHSYTGNQIAVSPTAAA